MSSGSRAVTKTGGSSPRLIEIRLVKGKKSDIFVEGSSTSVKHGTRLSIFIISSQLEEDRKQGHPSDPNPS